MRKRGKKGPFMSSVKKGPYIARRKTKLSNITSLPPTNTTPYQINLKMCNDNVNCNCNKGKKRTFEETETKQNDKDTILQILNVINRITANQKNNQKTDPIVVVSAGSQSSAKSSTINCMAGMGICPTSLGKCTKFILKYLVTSSSRNNPLFTLALPSGSSKNYGSQDEVKRDIDTFQQNLNDVSYDTIGNLCVEANDAIPMTIYDLPGPVGSESSRKMAQACLKIEGRDTDVVIVNTSVSDFDFARDRDLEDILSLLNQKKDGKVNGFGKKIIINNTRIDKIFDEKAPQKRSEMIKSLISAAHVTKEKNPDLDINFAVSQTCAEGTYQDILNAERKTIDSEEFQPVRDCRRSDGKPMFLLGIPAINSFIWREVLSSVSVNYIVEIEKGIETRENQLNLNLEKTKHSNHPPSKAKEVTDGIDDRASRTDMQTELESAIMELLVAKINTLYEEDKRNGEVPKASAKEESSGFSFVTAKVRHQDRAAEDVKNHGIFATRMLESLKRSSSGEILNKCIAIVDDYVTKAIKPQARFTRFHTWIMEQYFVFKSGKSVDHFDRSSLLAKIDSAILDQIASVDVVGTQKMNKFWKNSYTIVRDMDSNNIVLMLVESLNEIFPHVVRRIMLHVTLDVVKKFTTFLNGVMTKETKEITEISEEELETLEKEKDAIAKQREAIDLLKVHIANAMPKRQKNGENGVFGILKSFWK